ncbi:DUF6624 domain-containing protein [Aquimarina algiphila]|uniref:DUF6624 domain-containing protein n=1 Tax=Aquimarina algiphila TaxID=2047982 RepID=UPI0024918007|nr:DUF6624 domain-containing protein [Aquimarina algiphila]
MKKINLVVIAVFFTITLSFGQEKRHNQYLIKVLDTIYHLDQDPIDEARRLREKYGLESEEVKKQNKIFLKNQMISLPKVMNIIDTYGWLGTDIIGEQGNTTLFLVIQHADLDTQVKYLPVMREAAKKGDVYPRNLAYLEDRVASKQGKLQIYGSQVKYYPETKVFDVWPIVDPMNVDERRKSVGLGPLAAHLKTRFKLDWDLKKQLKRTADFKVNR